MSTGESIFPRQLYFSVKPTKLLTAIESLPEVKQPPRKSRDRFQELRKRLLEVDVEQMRQWKMKPKMLDFLPYLAAEKSNAQLWERVVVLALGGVPILSDFQLGRLLPYLISERTVIEAVNARFLRQAPKAGPRWLLDNWRALRTENPAARMALHYHQAGVSIFELRSTAELPAASDLTERVELEYWQLLSASERDSLGFQRSSGAVQSGLSLGVRQRLASHIFAHIGPEVHWAWLAIEHPVRELVDNSGALFSPEHATTSIKNWTTALAIDKRLRSIFRQDDARQRLNWWLRWRPAIQRIVLHRPTLTAAIQLAGGIIIERRSEPEVAYFCEATSDEILAQLWSKQVSLDALPLQPWNRSAEWQQEFDHRLTEQTGVHPLQG